MLNSETRGIALILFGISNVRIFYSDVITIFVDKGLDKNLSINQNFCYILINMRAKVKEITLTD